MQGNVFARSIGNHCSHFVPNTIRSSGYNVADDDSCASVFDGPDDLSNTDALLGELASAIRTLARLRLKGFHIAIDDYGTGFANAQQLSRVPATELKIDRSLTHRSAARPQQRTILASTVDLAKNLNLTTVAEGVETEEDFHIIQELGVDLVQGYYFSKPLSSEDLLAFIKTGLSQLRRQHERK